MDNKKPTNKTTLSASPDLKELIWYIAKQEAPKAAPSYIKNTLKMENHRALFAEESRKKISPPKAKTITIQLHDIIQDDAYADIDLSRQDIAKLIEPYLAPMVEGTKKFHKWVVQGCPDKPETTVSDAQALKGLAAYNEASRNGLWDHLLKGR